MVLLHGSKHVFDRFHDSKPLSVGHHFGDLEQALHRINHEGFIYKAKLTCESPLKVSEDLGWEHPGWTVKGLLKLKVFDYSELVRLQDEVDEGISIYLSHVDTDDRRKRNHKVITYIKGKGFDSIFYPNTNEPPDGHGRPAVCVFNRDQIEVIARYAWPQDSKFEDSLRSLKG